MWSSRFLCSWLLLFNFCVLAIGLPRDEKAPPFRVEHQGFVDLLDVPGRVIASKRIISVDRKTLGDPQPTTYNTLGADYVRHFIIADELKVDGVLLGVRGQVIEKEVTIGDENTRVWVHLMTNSSLGTGLTAKVYLSDPFVKERKLAENIDKNRWLAEQAIDSVVNELEQGHARLTLTYIHFVTDEIEE